MENKGRSHRVRGTPWRQALGRQVQYRKGGDVLSRSASFGLVPPRFNFVEDTQGRTRGIRGSKVSKGYKER